MAIIDEGCGCCNRNLNLSYYKLNEMHFGAAFLDGPSKIKVYKNNKIVKNVIEIQLGEPSWAICFYLPFERCGCDSGLKLYKEDAKDYEVGLIVKNGKTQKELDEYYSSVLAVYSEMING